MNKQNIKNLTSDCEKCFGLCCVALYFSSTEGFPNDKDAGKACIHLQNDYKCKVHKNLWEKGLKGCIGFECFGAGQKVSQVTFQNKSWRNNERTDMFHAFQIMRRLHEMLWYLTEALTLKETQTIHQLIKEKIVEIREYTLLDVNDLLKLDIALIREKVNTLLVKTSELVRVKYQHTNKKQKEFGKGLDYLGADLKEINFRGANLRGVYLIASDLRGVDMSGAILIGADLRDADIRGADLSKCIFLTQSQVNSAKGDIFTKLPKSLVYPKHWEN